MTIAGEPFREAEALDRLEVFVGEWTEEVAVPGVPPGSMTFFWDLDRRFLLQRSRIDDPAFPDSLCLIAVNARGDGYTQHYFDARGIVRTYAMSVVEGVWTLSRDKPDFTPLSFAQRFAGRFSDDGRSIRGAWERSIDGVKFEHAFDVIYTKVA